ncbi:MAG: transcriptional repressor NrdR [Candidatus Omnitrophica bacterium]|nr:transcriptional repressor NrdR [Candidatus Omnitrophota bacterium]
MTCPFCGHPDHKVIDSRTSADGQAIRRRRECLACGKRFTTYEHLEEGRLMVIKKDGRREPFDRNKLLAGLVKACEKRPVSMDQLEDLADEIERDLSRTFEREASSQEIGERVMRRLHDVDPVAYVRFASVYREFKDVEQFMRELKDVLAQKSPSA